MQIRPGYTISDTFAVTLAMYDRGVPVALPALDRYTVETITYADAAGISVKTTNGQHKTILTRRPEDYIVWDALGNLVSI